MSVDTVVSGVTDSVEHLKTLDMGVLLKTIVLAAVGIVLIRFVMKLVDRALERRKWLASLRGYIHTGVKTLLWCLLALILAQSLNVDVTSIIALLSIAGLAVSLALQSALSNLAGGIVIMVAKPFSVGDYVESDGISGTVAEIGLSYCKFITPENKELFVPNSQITDAKLTNCTVLGQRRMEIKLIIRYDVPVEEVKAALWEALSNFPQILPDPKPQVSISSYQPSGMEYLVRAWTGCEVFWDIYFELLEQIPAELKRHHIDMFSNQVSVKTQEK